MNNGQNENFHLKTMTLKIIVPILLAVTVLITSSGLLISKYLLRSNEPTLGSNIDSSSDDTYEPEVPVIYDKSIPASLKGVSVVPGVDFLTSGEGFDEAASQAKALIDSAKADKFNALNLTVNYNGGLICGGDFAVSGYADLLSYIHGYIKSNGMELAVTLDLGALAENSITNTAYIEKICTLLSSGKLTSYCDMLVFKNYSVTENDALKSDYEASNSELSYDMFITDRLTSAMKSFYNAVIKADCTLFTGIYVDGGMLTGSTAEDLFSVGSHADIVGWAKSNITDFIIVENSHSTTAEPLSFEGLIDIWNGFAFERTRVFFEVDYSKLGTNESGWKSTDQIVKQLMILGDRSVSNFMINSYTSFLNGNKESRAAIIKYLSGLISDDYILTDLSITSPKKLTFTTYEPTVALIGASDPQFSLTLNGKKLERNELGYFSLDLNLELGLNTFKLEHKGNTKTLKITYKKVIIKDYSPTETQKLPGGSTVAVSITAISNSTVTATLNAKTITLTEEVILDQFGNPAGEYSIYTGRFTVPSGFAKDTSIGNIKFKVQSKYGTESVTAAKITVEKTVVDNNNPSYVQPSGGNYVNVGNKYIGEVVVYQAETFDRNDNSDYSRPTNNYLPEGTVDYCSASTTTFGVNKLRTFRYGNLLYESRWYKTEQKYIKDIKIYEGKLPDFNTVNLSKVSNDGRHTTFTFDVDWKAPFIFELGPQKYRNEGDGENRDYTISSATYAYVDITFCYAAAVNGDLVVPENSPVFSRAEWIKNTSDYTLRLYLKKVGKFYGWNAEYNADGQLEFRFLNPAVITEADNLYGYSLDGVTVVVDAGHGGHDGGASGSNVNYDEAYLNLYLAKKIKSQLESIGATVVLTRDDDYHLSPTDRAKIIKSVKPDYVLSIHRDAIGNGKDKLTSVNGMGVYHHHPFASDAAKQMYNTYKNYNMSDKFNLRGNSAQWHVFYLARNTDCPVVLTENGFMTNTSDYAKMLSEDYNNRYAKILTQGIVNYFKSIQ